MKQVSKQELYVHKRDLQNSMQRSRTAIQKQDRIKVVAIYLVTLAVVWGATVVKLVVVEQQFGYYVFLGMLVGHATLIGSLCMYIVNSRKELVYKKRVLMALCFCVALSYAANIFLMTINPFAMSFAFVAFLAAPLADKRDVYVATLISVLMTTFGSLVVAIVGGVEYEITILALALSGIIVGTLVCYFIKSSNRRISNIVQGLLFGMIGFWILLFVSLIHAGDISLLEFLEYSWLYVVAAILGAVVVSQFLQAFIESIFNLVTDASLIELVNHSSPLIKRLIEQTPGTFSHSMTVANFAEVCAKAIGENPYLARAAAYYHDVGKLINPLFFKENQSDYNPHNEVLPEVSADVIRAHTTDGYELCIQHNIPIEIAEVAIQHHGNMVISVFYNKAKQFTDREVDIDKYSYHNDTPRTKIAALIMICDVAEASIRAMSKPGVEAVDKLLSKIILERITTGQFDNCDITIRDLDIIKQTIKSMYGGIFHARVQYPSGK